MCHIEANETSDSNHLDDTTPHAVPTHGSTGVHPSLPFAVHPAQVRKQLALAAPRLWKKVLAECPEPRDQHQRFTALVIWFLQKQSQTVESPFRQNYFDQGRVIQGRLDLLARGGDATHGVAVEISFKPTSSSAYKLLSCRRDGQTPLLLCGFASSAEDAHKALSRLCGRDTQTWFPVCCLATSGSTGPSSHKGKSR